VMHFGSKSSMKELAAAAHSAGLIKDSAVREKKKKIDINK